MRILVVGASGTIGKAVAAALGARHEVLAASRHGPIQIDLEDPTSIEKALGAAGALDAVVSCAGSAAFKPLAQLQDADFQLGLRNKLMGQVHLACAAFGRLRDGGSVTLTSGVLAQEPMPGGAAISLVNAALEGFTRGAAIELPRGLRINVVSPPWITETLIAYKMDPRIGIPAAACAKAYVAAVEGRNRGEVLDARKFA